MKITITPLCLIALLAPAACAPERPAPAAHSAAARWTAAEIRAILLRGTPERRLAAVRAIADLDPTAQQSLVPSMVEAMNDENPAVVEALRMALCGAGPAHSSALQRLRCAMKDHCAEVRIGAARALARMGRCAEEAIPELVDAVAEPCCGVRRAAMDALIAIGAPAVPALLEALLDADPAAGRRLIETLDRVDPDGRDALVSMGEPVLHYLLTRTP